MELHIKENNKENQDYLNKNRDKLSKQCTKVLRLLMKGYRLTTKTALLNYGIGDLRRRVKDLKDHNDVKVLSNRLDTGFKVYYITQTETDRLKLRFPNI